MKKKYYILDFFRNWTLPIAMTFGATFYLVFAGTPALNPLKPAIYSVINFITPVLIFAMLFLTFCRVSPKDLRFKKWHFILLAIQLLGCIAAYFLLLPINKIMAQAAMVCLICPTATAAPVITGKLGGSVPNLTTYTLLSNLMAAT